MKIAVVGATGLVGQTIISILLERQFPVTEWLLVASEKSVGKKINIEERAHEVISMEEAISRVPDIALFSAGGSTSLKYAPLFAEKGTTVIDNSSAWRMDPAIKLVVPEINADALTKEDKIIANPNCSTIQMLLVLKPIHDVWGVKKVIVSTYQSVSGTGQKAIAEMDAQRAGDTNCDVYPYPIDKNLIPHIDVFLDNGYTKEEMKMVLETKKIMRDEHIDVSPTCVRVPVSGGHSESIYIETIKPFELPDIVRSIADAPGVTLVDDVNNNVYPMPLYAKGKDDVFVGRIRKDISHPQALNCWVVADNLRKGAALNAVQIAEYLLKAQLV